MECVTLTNLSKISDDSVYFRNRRRFDFPRARGNTARGKYLRNIFRVTLELFKSLFLLILVFLKVRWLYFTACKSSHNMSSVQSDFDAGWFYSKIKFLQYVVTLNLNQWTESKSVHIENSQSRLVRDGT